MLIFLLLTPLRLNSSSSDSKTNFSKYTTFHLIPPTLLEILALSLTNILLSLTKLQLSQKHVTITFVDVSFAVSGLTLSRQLQLLPLSFTPNLITVIISPTALRCRKDYILLYFTSAVGPSYFFFFVFLSFFDA